MLIILGVGGLVGTFFYIDYKTKEFEPKIKQAKIDGEEFGKTTDQNGYIEKGFSLEVPKSSYDLSNESFVKECLKSSKPIQDFCNNVPTIFDRKWFEEQCQKVPNKYEACVKTLIPKRDYCMNSKK